MKGNEYIFESRIDLEEIFPKDNLGFRLSPCVLWALGTKRNVLLYYRYWNRIVTVHFINNVQIKLTKRLNSPGRSGCRASSRTHLPHFFAANFSFKTYFDMACLISVV
jgi:hypothetical protein